MARKNSGARQAHLFDNAHGTNGKGDGDRTTDREAFRRNLDEVHLSGRVDGLRYIGGGRYRKTYGGA